MLTNAKSRLGHTNQRLLNAVVSSSATDVVADCSMYRGYVEGDGGVIYSGASLTAGYGMQYRENFVHHSMEIPGLHGRGGIYFVRTQDTHLPTPTVILANARLVVVFV